MNLAVESLENASPAEAVAGALAGWYAKNRRDLPWRTQPGRRPDPYRVWLSEIMLQQTTVRAVAPYYAAFIARWPAVEALAAAPLEDVLAEWAGLGYYARARNLHACAQAVVTRHGGRFPVEEDALRALPGIGPYTAAAIAAMAFDKPATPVDGNIERVVARLFSVERPLPGVKPALKRLAATLTPKRGAGDHAQAMMDLGATICTPKRPSCTICPVISFCAAREAGIQKRLPVKAVKPDRPKRTGEAFVALRDDGAILLRRRPPRGLLGGMLETPTSGWRSASDAIPTVDAEPFPADWREAGSVRHVFTHFELTLTVYVARAPQNTSVQGGLWAAPRELRALPSLMRKVVALALTN